MQPAPFHADLAEGPEGGAAHWLTAADGTKLRLAHYPAGAWGTVLMFTGRTEYVEKYGRAAAEFGARGLAMATLDWRGQGLSNRTGAAPHIGHVGDFAEFRQDVAVLRDYAERLNLPRPFYLCAHSMGGAIGLRALLDGLDVAAAVFSAPMWGIRIRPLLRPAARVVTALGTRLGLGTAQMLMTSARTYVDEAPFEGNLLTTDPGFYAYMRRQTTEQPALALGGPSIGWLAAALAETRALARLRAPGTPCLVFVGSDEQIVEPSAIHDRMKAWDAGQLHEIDGARHEIMMETPAIQAAFFDAAATHFRAHR